VTRLALKTARLELVADVAELARAEPGEHRRMIGHRFPEITAPVEVSR
jgi:hypothetical protein